MLSELGKAVLLYGIASGISKFIGIFLIPLFSRHYSPEEFGSLELISTVFSLASILGLMQLESSISRYYYEAEGHKRDVFISTGFWAVFMASLIITILVMLFSKSISVILFQSARYNLLIRVSAFNILLLNIFSYLIVILRFKNKPLLFSTIVFIQFLTTFVVSFSMIVYYQKGISAFFAGQIAGLGAGTIAVVICLKNHLVLKFDRNVLKDFFRYSLPQVPAVAGSFANSYANRFVMLSQLTFHDIGIYSVALKIASLFNLLESAFRMAWEPFIWKKIKLADHQNILSSLSVVITSVVLSIALLFMLFSRELILLLSTKTYLESLPIIKILLFAFVFQIIVQVIGIGTSIAKKTIYNTISFLAGVLFNLGLLFVLIPQLGLTAVPLSLALGNIVMFFLMWYYSEKNYYIGFPVKLIFSILIAFFTATFLIFYYEAGILSRLSALFLFIGLLIIKRKYLAEIVFK